jgi:predicted HAD superfamily hydrolase
MLMKILVHSFDVFDTSIVRIWAKPTDLFWELGYQLQKENLIQVIPESWSRIRIEAERIVRKTRPDYEVTLAEIYQQLAISLNWSEEEAQKALQKEIEIELLSLRPIPTTQKRIQSLHQENKRIIYISDMYLPEEVIRNFLKENKVWTPGSTLYVSSEVRVNKGSGKLFQHCLSQESLKNSLLYHIGDNLRSDIKAAKKQGIPCEAFTQAHLNRYEGKIAEATELPLKFRSLLAGASRLTRLQSQETSHDKQAIWDTTASAIAPTLFGFVYWCLVEAQKIGIQRLYFVARDGQILRKIAQVICQNWGYAIDCRYLYGSRQAWHLPAIEEIGEAEIDWILFGTEIETQFHSLRSICNRINILPEQIEDVLSRYGFSEAKWDFNLQQHERKLLRKIFTEKEVTELIISTAATYREKALGYFCQEGIGDGVPFGLVDMGWSGRMQRSFSRLLNIANLYPESSICGFYFALHSRVKPFKKDSLFAYFNDIDKPKEHYSISRYTSLFEMFTAADHGSTVSYEQYDNKYTPVLRSPKNEKAIDWGLYTLQGSAVEFAKQITTNLNEQECTTNFFLKATEILTKELVLNPSDHEAKVFGSFLVSADQTENAFYEIAPIYSLTDLLKLLFYNQQIHTDVWFPASVARGDFIVKTLLELKEISIVRKIKKILGLGKFKQKLLLKAKTT